MVYRVNILVKDPDPVFAWAVEHIPSGILVRQVAKGVNYKSWKAGASFSVCPSDHPDFGWVVQIFVNDRETADRIISTWKPQTERCDLITIGA
jgi:hypothetical protein